MLSLTSLNAQVVAVIGVTVLWPFAVASLEIAGVDVSDQMLDLARAKGNQYELAVRERVCLYRMDMTSFELKGPSDS